MPSVAGACAGTDGANTRSWTFVAAFLLSVFVLAPACRRVPARRPRRAQTHEVVRDAGPPPRLLEAPPAPSPPLAFRTDRLHSGRSGYLLPRRPRVLGSIATGARISSSAVALPGVGLVFGSHDGRLYVLALADGRKLWSYDLGQAVASGPAVVDGKIIVGCDDGFVYAFGAKREHE